MKGAEGFIAQMNPDLTVNRQEVNASPMLDLVEVRTRWWEDRETARITTVYYDRGEASKLASALDAAILELAAAGPALEGEEASTRAADDASPHVSARYVAVREVAGGWRIFDRLTSQVLLASYPESDEPGARRWAEQLNESAALAAARARAGEARAA